MPNVDMHALALHNAEYFFLIKPACLIHSFGK